jgi:cell shape-determining protein MreC
MKLDQLKKFFIITLSIFIIGIIIYLLVISILGLSSKDDTSYNIEEKKIDWQIDIPENYNVKENKTFSCEYFNIYYSSIEKKYYISVLQGSEFEIDNIEEWITNLFEQFDDLKTVNMRNIEFNDERNIHDNPDHLLT